MRKWVPALIPALVAGLFNNQANAGEINIKATIPQINTAEYHRPYMAIWIEKPDQSVQQTLAAWYSQKRAANGDEGQKWLKDLRQWWRKGGREQTLPIDGVSGATRPVGEQSLTFTEGKKPLGTLPPGQYNIAVEAAREKGGREIVRVPFTWPVQKAEQVKGAGQQEIGNIVVDLKP